MDLTWDTPADEKFSFQVEVDRGTYERKLFTESEINFALEYIVDNPEVILVVLLFQATIQDYFLELRRAITDIKGENAISLIGLNEFDEFAKQWETGNFADELVPAIALFMKKEGKHGRGEAPNQDIFAKALNFIVSNGAFRNFIDVPKHVAADKKAREQRFMCPALGKIKSLLLDGSLFNTIYMVLAKKVKNMDPVVLNLTSSIKSKTFKVLSEAKTRPRSRQEMEQRMEAMWEERKTKQFNFNGTLFVFKITDEFIESHKNKKEAGDGVFELHAGDDLYDVFAKAINMVFQQNQSVSFNFNGTNYRLTEEDVEIVTGKKGFKKRSLLEKIASRIRGE